GRNSLSISSISRRCGRMTYGCISVVRPSRRQPIHSPPYFFNAPATTEIYTLSLHDALPILGDQGVLDLELLGDRESAADATGVEDRKSTRLNSSHDQISYAVFCLKKKKRTLLPTSALPSALPTLSVSKLSSGYHPRSRRCFV